MSTIWTPSGEQPVNRAQPADAGEGGEPPGGTDEVEAHLRQLQEELAQTPAAVVIANHVMGLFELAALHLSQQPPNFPEAQLGIDAMGAIIERLAGRLGQHETTLQDALAQIRLAFVQIRAAAGLAPDGPPESATTGG